MPMVGKLEHEGTVNSEHLKNPKNAVRHMTSMAMMSKGLKNLDRRIETKRLRILVESGERCRGEGSW